MNIIWNYVNSFNVTYHKKNELFILINVLANAVLGGIAWATAGRWFLPGIESLLCFVGYPAFFIGFVATAFYLYRHEF